MDSIFIIQYGPAMGGGIISVHYDEDDANAQVVVAACDAMSCDAMRYDVM